MASSVVVGQLGLLHVTSSSECHHSILIHFTIGYNECSSPHWQHWSGGETHPPSSRAPPSCDDRWVTSGMGGITQQTVYINVLKLFTMFLALKQSLPFLKGHHILVTTDNTSRVACVNHQGGRLSTTPVCGTETAEVEQRTFVVSICYARQTKHRRGHTTAEGSPQRGMTTLEMLCVVTVNLFALWENAQCPWTSSVQHVLLVFT